MKVALSMLHFAGLRTFEPVVRALVERGHSVHLSADEPERLGGRAAAERLAAEYPHAVTWDFAPSGAGEPCHHAALRLRTALDYVRFSGRRYRGSPKLRRRFHDRAPRLVRALLPVVRPAAAEWLLTRVERLMPRSEACDEYWRRISPDVLLLTSLTISRSRQLDHLKSARVLGIPAAACIASWDHLSSKALLHLAPDLVLVWNDVQVQEAVTMHGLPADRIVATGAQCYDHWFGRQPARSREAFCAGVGLRPDRPFILYVCSALTPAPDPPEPVFVRRWIDALRADPVLREVGVLVRPHPERRREWDGVSLEGLDQVVFHGANPIDEDARSEYFDALYHCSAVVGIVTSAFLEACIVGRPILTVLVPEYRAHQEEMVHFRYLLQIDGGILRTAETLQMHTRQLREALAQSGCSERNQQFLARFVRPRGLDVPATPVFVEAVERLAARGPSPPDPALVGAPVLRRATALLAERLGGTKLGRWLLMDVREEANVRAEKEKARQQQRRAAAARARRAAELAERARLERLDARRERAKWRRHRWRQLRYDLAMRIHRGRRGALRFAQRALSGTVAGKRD